MCLHSPSAPTSVHSPFIGVTSSRSDFVIATCQGAPAPAFGPCPPLHRPCPVVALSPPRRLLSIGCCCLPPSLLPLPPLRSPCLASLPSNPPLRSPLRCSFTLVVCAGLPMCLHNLVVPRYELLHFAASRGSFALSALLVMISACLCELCSLHGRPTAVGSVRGRRPGSLVLKLSSCALPLPRVFGLPGRSHPAARWNLSVCRLEISAARRWRVWVSVPGHHPSLPLLCQVTDSGAKLPDRLAAR